ncbi:MAG: PadR family transcriptional regulator [Desulfurococcales archaeon]|nr:PadR family transcriptional regulator [Desulfurococcales archaeon]
MNAGDPTKKLLRYLKAGVYAYLILSILKVKGRVYGYMLLTEIARFTEGYLNPSESTVYETLKELERRGLVRSYWGLPGGRGPPRKYYELTPRGYETLRELREEVARLVKVLEKASRLYEGGG